MILFDLLGKLLENLFKPYFDSAYQPELITWLDWVNGIFILSACLFFLLKPIIDYFNTDK